MNEAERVREKLINNLIKHKAINTILENRSDSIAIAVRAHTVEDDMFALPAAAPAVKETKDRFMYFLMEKHLLEIYYLIKNKS